MHRILPAFTLPLALAALAPPGEARAADAPRPGSVAVAAASSLRPALEELRRAFEAERPGARVAVSYGASGALLAQIQAGAPFDLFFSADVEYPVRAVASGLARPEDQAVFAVGRLCLWLPPGAPADLRGRGLSALADPRLRRIAIANPAVAPYGRAAEAALRAAGLLEAVRPRLVMGQSVSQAAGFAAGGAADAALVPLSLAREPALAAGTAVPLAGAEARLEHAAAVLARARDPALARAFLGFALGPAGRTAFRAHGYELP
ncbi:MAG TPA: molybdate ABC transporter substrate-binding protein [Anaeromyxobacteraceae bacterium]|nr:molybdate ABC transporter substrate-binding protein [Anaeromyxobacteraceae bacterium]